MRITPGSDMVTLLKKAKANEAIFIEPGKYRGGGILENVPGVRIVVDGGLCLLEGGPFGLKIISCNGFYVAGIGQQGAQNHGFFIVECIGGEVTGCHPRKNMHSGILTANSSHIKLNKNHCNNNGLSGEGHGIYVSQSGDQIFIEDNECNENRRSGIQVNAHDESALAGTNERHDSISDGVLIARNKLNKNQKAGGAAINIAQVHNGQVIDNEITDHLGRNMVALFTDQPLDPKQYACHNIEIDGNTFHFAHEASPKQNILVGPESKNIKIGTRNQYDSRAKNVEGV